MEVDQKELAIVKQQATKAHTAAVELQVRNAEELSTAADILSKIKTVQKLVTEKKEAITKPLNEALKNVRALFAPAEDMCKESETIVKQKMVEYQREEQRKTAEAEKKILDRVEKGTLKPDTAEKKLDAIATPQTKVATESGAKAQFRTRRIATVFDESLIPREYLEPNLGKISKDALEGINIPGVKVEEVTEVAGYSRK